MAVTQQLARLAYAHLCDCHGSVEAMANLLSFEALPKEQHLDLDWSPSAMEAAVKLAGLPLDCQRAVELATGGARIVNLNLPAGVVWDGSPRENNPVEVKWISGILGTLDVQVLITACNSQPTVIIFLRDATVDERASYLEKHIGALQRFYRDAHDEGQAVVAWWD